MPTKWTNPAATEAIVKRADRRLMNTELNVIQAKYRVEINEFLTLKATLAHVLAEAQRDVAKAWTRVIQAPDQPEYHRQMAEYHHYRAAVFDTKYRHAGIIAEYYEKHPVINPNDGEAERLAIERDGPKIEPVCVGLK